MIVRSSKFLLLFLVATLLGAVLFSLVAIWQLSRGPVSLSFLTPYVEESLSGGPTGVRVRLHDTVITWAGFERTLDLRAVGLDILDDDGELVASVPEMAVQLSARALLRGKIAPTALELFGPRLRMVRTEDGDIVVGFAAVAADGTPLQGQTSFIDRLLESPAEGSPLGYLRRVAVVSALIDFEDRQSGRNWTAQRADITVQRDRRGIRADGIIVIDAGEGFARFEVSGVLNRATRLAELGVSFEDVSPPGIARLDRRLAPLERLRLPVSGTLALSLDETLTVAAANFDLTAEAGELDLPELYAAPLSLAALSLRGRLGDGLSELVVDDAMIDLGGPKLSLSGGAERRDDSIDFHADIRAATVPVNALHDLWPADVGANARSWITRNIKNGQVSSAGLSLSGATRADDLAAVVVGEASGDFQVSGATVHYLRPMTPVDGVTATGRFDGKSLIIDVASGAAGALTVDASRIAIEHLTDDGVPEVAKIELTVSGPAPDALALLDQEPLKFMSRFGIVPERTRGVQSTNAVLVFPLLDKLTVEQVDVAATARLDDFDAAAIAFGSDMTGGAFNLSVNKERLVAAGRATLAGTPLEVTWTELFADDSALRTRYEVQTVLDDGDRDRLGLGAAPMLSGPVGVGLTYEISSTGEERGAANLNLTDATLSLEDFGWRKPPGEAAAATVAIVGRGGVIGEISDFSVTAAGLSARGRATLEDRGEGLAVSQVELSRLLVGETDISLRADLPKDAPPDIVVGGDNLDLRILVATAFADDGGDTPALRLRTDPQNPLRRVRLGEETALINPRGRMVHDGENWSDVELAGALSGGGNLAVRIQPVDGRRSLTIRSDDGGAVFRALDWVNTIEGGELLVRGNFLEREGEEVLAGQVDLTDFKLNESSVTVRVISLASLSGISDAVAGTGITMRRTEIPFELTDKEIRIGDAKARGGGVGIIGTGRIDRVTDQAEIRGEIAPANIINSVLSNIPLVKELIGDGIIAVAYSVTGPIDDPSISVNPLTVFVPGVFRKAFTGFGGEGAPGDGTSAPPRPATPSE